MAQTDARPGFRLPWSSERSNEQTDIEQAEGQLIGEDMPTDAPAADHEAPVDAQATDDDGAATAVEAPPWVPEGESSPTLREATAGRKPSKFLADLTKAMQTAAEEARSLSVSQFQADTKAYIEQIHERSSTEAASLRRTADDDVAGVREWSKQEIARIREDTESRISARKSQLDGEIETHTVLIGREVERVQAQVTEFESEMAAFFERLLAEDDPSRFATMAERLPEPPSFEEMSARSDFVMPSLADDAPEETVAEAPTDEADMLIGDTVDATDSAESIELTEPADVVETFDVTGTVEAAEGEPTDGAADEMASTNLAHADMNDGEGFEIDREAAFAAIQAAAEAAASAEVATDAAARAELVADMAIEIVGSHDDGDGSADSRVSALGLTPDYEAAEAEAAASADATGDGEEILEIGDDALAARLADLLPRKSADRAKSSETKTTQVVVVGLVSVASIASFKRHLGRLPGVASVGVSSGPDGEFLFAVNHTADVVLRDAIPGLPSFQARVTASGEGTVNVTAHDPESDN
jgi:hypothetical protein